MTHLNLGSILFLWSSIIFAVSTFIWRTEIAVIAFPFTCKIWWEHRPLGKNKFCFIKGCTSLSISDASTLLSFDELNSLSSVTKCTKTSSPGIMPGNQILRQNVVITNELFQLNFSIILRNLPLNFTHKCTSIQSQSVFFVEWLSIKRSGVKQFHSLIARAQRLKKPIY